MSDTIDDDEDGLIDDAKAKGGAIDDEDVRGLLQKRTKERDQLAADLATERRRASAAEATSQNSAAARFEAEEARIAAQIDARETTLKAKERELAEAYHEARFDDAARVQREMARFEAQAMRDTEHLAWVKGEREKAKTPAPSQGIDISKFSRAQRDWVKEHPVFMDDTVEGATMRRLCFAGHEIAQAQGIPEDSEDYFAIIENVVNNGGKVSMRERPRGRTAADILDEDDDEPPAPRRREPPASAPVQRRQPATDDRGDAPVRLTAEEGEAADFTMSHIPLQRWKDEAGNTKLSRYEQYKKNQSEAKRRGQLN